MKKEQEYEWGTEQKQNSRTKITILMIFLGIILIIVFTAFSGQDFYKSFSFTGHTVKGINIQENGVRIEGELTIPQINLEQAFKKIEIKGKSNSFFYADNQRFDLTKLRENNVILEDYAGEISFDSKNIKNLQGKVNKVIINDISISPESGNTIKVHFNENFNYDSVIIEKAFLEELVYNTTGIINLNNGKNILNLNNEEIKITNFQGRIMLENKKFKLEGYLQGLNTNEISVQA